MTVNDIVKAALNTYTEYISSLDGILQIYLFDLHAYGSPHEFSDIDLMVIVEDRIDPFKLTFQVQKKLSEREVALDLAVNRQAAFEKAAKEPTLQSMVKGKGVLLYAKQ